MKESRVAKFEAYRNSISKEGSKNFRAPSKEEVSIEMGLFLKTKRQNLFANLAIITTIVVIASLIIAYGVILFGR